MGQFQKQDQGNMPEPGKAREAMPPKMIDPKASISQKRISRVPEPGGFPKQGRIPFGDAKLKGMP